MMKAHYRVTQNDDTLKFVPEIFINNRWMACKVHANDPYPEFDTLDEAIERCYVCKEKNVKTVTIVWEKYM